jgi:hypothetical protein
MSMANFQDPTGLGRAATIALCAYMAFRALMAIWLLIVMPGAQPVAFLGIGYLVSLLACYILVACWIYRANANAHLFGGSEMTISPGWSVGWFFVPFANLVMPFRGVNETWQASQRAAGRFDNLESPLLGWWWGLWIANNIAANIAVYLGGDTSYAGPELHFFNLVAASLGIAGSLILIQLMSRLNGAQLDAARGSVFA